MTNREFADNDKNFQKACEEATRKFGRNIYPTARQAFKYRMKRGLAYKCR